MIGNVKICWLDTCYITCWLRYVFPPAMASFNQALMFFLCGSTLNGSYLALAAATSAKCKMAV